MTDSDAYLRAYLGRDDVALAPEGEVSHFDQLPLSVLTTATPRLGPADAAWRTR
ncbi:hypothetical protein ACTG9Q_26880 [Actinokineospora sp. 24-640]